MQSPGTEAPAVCTARTEDQKKKEEGGRRGEGGGIQCGMGSEKRKK